MFTKEDGPTINNEDTAEFKIRKNATIYSTFKLLKSSRKNQHF